MDTVEYIDASEYFKSFSWIPSFYFPEQPNEVYNYSLHFIEEVIKF